VEAVRQRLESQPEVEVVVDLLTMLTGTDKVLVCARLDFIDDVSAGDLERASLRIHAELTQEYPDLDEIFLEPVPRTDPELRKRVCARYGPERAGAPSG
jgi:divalent metal cation (Fe/Co/Zn/Cd) transporter